MGTILNHGVILAATLAGAAPAAAFQFESAGGETSGSFDTTVSYGASMRAQGREPSLVGITNGGTARSVNEDDGNLNYDKGDMISSALKVTHDLDLKRGNYGLLLRGSYFYDYIADHKDELGTLARDRTDSDVQLLDAFVRGGFDVGGRALNLRYGKQVVSWGESTFIGNGVNVINPVDVAKLRTPGAELKEGLIPTTMLWASQELGDHTSVEALVLTNFNKTRTDPRGTFFSTNDFGTDDGDKAYVGFGRRKDQHFSLANYLTDTTAQAWIPRADDRMPSDHGQHGLSLRQFVPDWNNTEFGLYYLKYHSRTPIATGIRGSASTSLGTGTARYFIEYPEDIHLYGLSFNSTGPGGSALQGEYSYRPNQPMQLATIELLLAGLGAANNITGDATAANAVPVGTEISGYRRVHMHQLQLTATKVFSQVLGAEQLALTGEAGYTYLSLPAGLLFAGPGTHLPAPGSSTATSGGSVQPNGEGYATKGSSGYRLLMRLDFPGAIGAATLSPRIALSHDVNGVSPTFNEGAKALTFGLGFGYKQNWQADLAYTNYYGGRTYSGTDSSGVPSGQSADYASNSNPLKDRDFVALSVSYSF
ncbi:MAG: hypothetical protein A2637_02925 [Candidatus Muproteobacteria bacterium RIFCSPHIGHO2_01_FULL_65_16]|uniref:DUF1302 domain-containing protein n=1 Tax=Candidatus Muproteobacteria bacterium RIFCSPHIGHO2_01_FULL_65_16 TaxID=1817764 RepID=A0A1F6TKI8_9PROT|nr:MAG: hypothetical protein A2637_02925 [Candidatus Muproteobacteria bacterium RIFCSPHIGHO2_01_FULL_65_16]